MPTISVFLGIIIGMYYADNQQHYLPHIHAEYGGAEAVFSVDTRKRLAGRLPPAQGRLVRKWLKLRHRELLSHWDAAAERRPLPMLGGVDD